LRFGVAIGDLGKAKLDAKSAKCRQLHKVSTGIAILEQNDGVAGTALRSKDFFAARHLVNKAGGKPPTHTFFPTIIMTYDLPRLLRGIAPKVP
jgi:hypothetical protein